MVGSFMGQIFTVSSQKIFTPTGLRGQTGSDWATHDLVGGKARSQWVGPKLRKYSFDILLRAQDGVPPRRTLENLQRIAESAAVDWLVIGNAPISQYPFRITEISDEWGAVISKGVMVECKVNLSVEEYL